MKDLRFDPEDEQERKETKHPLTFRRYIQFSIMLIVFFLIMSTVNIYQKSWAMFETTGLGAVVACVFAIAGGLKKKESIVGAGICACVIIMFSFYAVIGGNDGFSILWILLIPAAIPLLSVCSGMLVSSYFLIFLFLLFNLQPHPIGFYGDCSALYALLGLEPYAAPSGKADGVCRGSPSVSGWELSGLLQIRCMRVL